MCERSYNKKKNSSVFVLGGFLLGGIVFLKQDHTLPQADLKLAQAGFGLAVVLLPRPPKC